MRSVAMFNNKRVRVKVAEDEYAIFDSKGEALRFNFLRLKERIGDLKNLKRQVKYHFTNDEFGLVCTYIADFVFELPNGEVIVEDFKSPATITREFKIKCMLMQSINNQKVRIITSTQVWPYGK